MTPDIKANKKLSPTVTELFLRGRKLNISLVFILKSSFKVPKTIRLNTTHYFLMKIPYKREIQQIVSNHLSDTEFKGFMKLCKDYPKVPFSFWVDDTNLPSDNPLRRTYYKIKVSETIRPVNNKIEQNKAQHDLDRQNVKASGNVAKY